MRNYQRFRLDQDMPTSLPADAATAGERGATASSACRLFLLSDLGAWRADRRLALARSTTPTSPLLRLGAAAAPAAAARAARRRSRADPAPTTSPAAPRRCGSAAAAADRRALTQLLLRDARRAPRLAALAPRRASALEQKFGPARGRSRSRLRRRRQRAWTRRPCCAAAAASSFPGAPGGGRWSSSSRPSRQTPGPRARRSRGHRHAARDRRLLAHGLISKDRRRGRGSRCEERARDRRQRGRRAHQGGAARAARPGSSSTSA